MQTFASYKAAADSFGSRLEDRDDWIVLITQHRDSDHVDESNFAAALKTLGGESETCEVIRFGHWAVGWIEHIFLHPSRAAEADAIEERLAEYPLLDENDLGERESNAAYEGWVSWGCAEFCKALQEQFDLMDSTVDVLRGAPDWTLHTFESSEPYVLSTEGDRVRVKAYGGQMPLTRDQLAALILKVRRAARSHV